MDPPPTVGVQGSSVSTFVLDVVRLQRAPGAHRAGLRAGASVLVPLLLVVLTGHQHWAPYASFGAFTSLYGRFSPHGDRLRMQLTAGLLYVLVCAVATLVSLGCPVWLKVGLAAALALGAHLVAVAQGYHPPGPLFFVFAYGGVCAMPDHTSRDLLPALLVSGAAACFSMLVGIIGVSRHADWRRRLVQAGEQTPVAFGRPEAVWMACWMAAAVAVTGFATDTWHLGHPWWAMITSTAPLTAPHVTARLARGVQRSLGTAVGLVLAWFVVGLHPSPAGMVLLIAVLQVLTETVSGRNYALGMFFMTPMALTMGQLAHPWPVGVLLHDRALETLVGSLAGIGAAVAARTCEHLYERRERRRSAGMPRRALP